MKTLSVIIPVHNEAENIAELLTELYTVLAEIDYEILLVDDGSTDNSAFIAKENANAFCKVIELTKNFGQSAAIEAGIVNSNAKYIATIDGDLQNDPADILRMLYILETEQIDIVAGNRIHRADSPIKKIPSGFANKLIRYTTKVQIKDYGCTLKLMKSEFAQQLHLHGELHRFIPVFLAMQGARIKQIDVNHRPRKKGISKYGISRTYKVLSDLLLVIFFQKFMHKPMHLFGSVGLPVLAVGVIINLYMLYLKIMGNDIWGRPLLLLGLFFVIAGIQILSIGIFAEILIRTYDESQKKKPYVIRTIWTHHLPA